MPIVRLSDAGDARLAVYAGATDAQLRDDPEYANGLFIGESRKVIERALAAGVRPVSLFLEERWLDQTMPLIERLLASDPAFPVLLATRDLFRAVTGYEVTRGALAAFQRPALPKAPDAWPCSRTWRTTRTSGPRSVPRPRSASTRCS